VPDILHTTFSNHLTPFQMLFISFYRWRLSWSGSWGVCRWCWWQHCWCQ